ncbi:MAG: SusC/RagA family TonB-linked outer membrane protein [Tannerella sp.]|jgi:TonB-linked SusC/RagA family outer membrane protein|nr:SusC/RagA family TonB-linked outer membrane protein [Tannerella sp.]
MTKRLFTLLVVTLLWGGGQIAHSQTINVTGKVTDETGEPVAGATVLVKGTTTGTATNEDGLYTISASRNAILEFHYIGYDDIEEPVNGRAIINVQLKSGVVNVDEVVVVAYGTTKKSTFTGSAVQVNAEKILKTPAANAAASLQGLSAGVSVVNNQGNPTKDPIITIRGVGSIQASTSPLYVVDGVPYDGSLNSFSSADIESISVLKDAAASSMYGSRAANGVIMITTKNGKSTKPTVSVNTSWGYSDLAVKFPKIMDAGTFYEYQWEALYNDQFYVLGKSDTEARQYATDNVIPYLITAHTNSAGQTSYVHPYNSDKPVGLDGKLRTDIQYLWDKSDSDWEGLYLQKRLRQEYTATVSGINQDNTMNYLYSGSFLDDKGMAVGQQFNRYTLRANVSNKINKYISTGVNLSYAHTRENDPGVATRFMRNMPPYASPYLRNNDNTDWVYNEKTGDRMYDWGYHRKDWAWWNALAESIASDSDNPQSLSFSTSYRDVIAGRAFLEIDIMPGLKYRSNVSVDNQSYKNNYYGSAIHGYQQSNTDGWGTTIIPGGGSAAKSTTRKTATTWNNLLTYQKTFADVHNINLLLGQEMYAYGYEYFYGYRDGIMSANRYELSSASGENYSLSSYRDEYRLVSFFGRAEYNFNDKYYLSGSYRRDGSSRFHPDARWGNFFSAGASWRISHEEFIKSIEWINNLSLRASYGTTGNDKISYYAYQGTFAPYNLYNISGVQLSTLPTPSLQWEKNVQSNIGLDFTLFNKLNGTIEYFNRGSKDLLYYRDLPISGQTGNATGYNTNLGDIENRGLEVTLQYTPVRTKDLSWTIDANWTYLKNEITSLPDGDYTYSGSYAQYMMREGGTRYDFIAPRYAGIDPETGNTMWWKKIFDANGNVTGREKTTSYAEVSSVSQFDVIGSAVPKHFGSVTNSLNFKGIDFSFMFYYSLGSYSGDHMYVESRTMRRSWSLVEEFVKGRWQKPGDIANYPRLRTENGGGYIQTRQYSDEFVLKNDFLRLRNVMLGYTLPSSLTRKVGIQSLRIYATGVNLATWGAAARRGTDPELQASGEAYDGNNGNSELGASKQVSCGLQITF